MNSPNSKKEKRIEFWMANVNNVTVKFCYLSEEAARKHSIKGTEITHLIEASPVLAQIKLLNGAFDELKSKVAEHRMAYGLDIFPNSGTLNENSSRDSISAKMGRHMCDCFIRYIDETLAKLKEE